MKYKQSCLENLMKASIFFMWHIFLFICIHIADMKHMSLYLYRIT